MNDKIDEVLLGSNWGAAKAPKRRFPWLAAACVFAVIVVLLDMAGVFA